MIRNIFLLLRPHQWVKNTFCFLPLFFDRHVMDIEYLIPCVIAFLSFCFAASGIYCFNDIYDIEADHYGYLLDNLYLFYYIGKLSEW